MIDLNSTIVVPDDVLVRTIEGEAVLLNLATETYHGLDAVSTDFWIALTETRDLAEAHARLSLEFAVDADELRVDLIEFVESLRAAGIVDVVAS